MLAVVTGGSRGLGAALLRDLIARGHRVIAAARGPAPLLSDRLHWTNVDLADPAAAGAWIEQAMTSPHPRPDQVALILNAGIIDPLCPVRDLPPAETEHHLRLNLLGPMLCTAAFLCATESWGVERRVMAISSGAARRGVPHWSAYCAAKAGLDGFIRGLASEEHAAAAPMRAVSIAPGLVDTAMQEIVRTRDTPTRARFREAFETGALVSAEDTAARLLDYLLADAFGTEPTADLRDVIARKSQP